MPKRIQRRRTAGWRKPEGAVNCTRPGPHGNPFYPGSGLAMGGFNDKMEMVWPASTPENCVAWFRKRIETMRDHQPKEFEIYIAPLRGKDLMCWCGLKDPCHVDVLLEFAKQPVCEEA